MDTLHPNEMPGPEGHLIDFLSDPNTSTAFQEILQTYIARSYWMIKHGYQRILIDENGLYKRISTDPDGANATFTGDKLCHIACSLAQIGISSWAENNNVSMLNLQMFSGNFDFEYANRGNLLYKPKLRGHTIMRFVQTIYPAPSVYFIDFTHPQLDPRANSLIKVFPIERLIQSNLTNIGHLTKTEPVTLSELNLNISNQHALRDDIHQLFAKITR